MHRIMGPLCQMVAKTRPLLLVGLVLAAGLTSNALAQNFANILTYHRFGENRYPSTNIRLEQFEAHLDRLQQGGYQVLPLIEVMRRLQQGIDLPDRTVAITVDDAFVSFATEAWPRLRARAMPVTLFVATDPVDQEQGGYLDWETLRALKREGVEIGHHSANHGHYPKMGLEAARADLRAASARFQAEIGSVPRVFAYPYGEFSPALEQMIEEEGFIGAVAQYSSPASDDSSRFALPRFALNEAYGSSSRFNLVVGSKPLPVQDILPASPVMTDDSNPPLFGFTVDPIVGSLDTLACFPSHMDRAAEVLYPGPRRVEVRFRKPFPKGRSRINCTMRAPDGRYYWFGHYFFQTGAEE